MRFPYHQIDDDSIEPAGSIQDTSNHHPSPGARNNDYQRNDDLEDLATPSFKQLLPYWPFILGIFQIATGFLCAIFGVVVVLILPFKVNVEAELGLNKFNFYGAAVWSGILLVISGSCAVRTAKIRSLISVKQFYLVTLFSFLANTTFLILMLWCYMSLVLHGDVWDTLDVVTNGLLEECHLKKIPEDVKPLCDAFEAFQQYSIVNLVSAVWCMFGCLLLFLSTVNYSQHVFFGEVHLLKSLAVCWLPCCFYSPPSQASSYQSVNSDYSMQNAII